MLPYRLAVRQLWNVSSARHRGQSRIGCQNSELPDKSLAPYGNRDFWTRLQWAVVRSNNVVGKTMRWGLSSAAMLIASLASAQTFNVYEGYGTLENGWADWSWCTRNFNSSDYKFNSRPSIQVQYTGGWQGLALNFSNTFPAQYFNAVSFEINGGATSGRSINVILTVNGSYTSTVNLNSYVHGGTVAANAWNLVQIPLSAFGVKSTDKISQVLLQESSGNAQPSFYVSQLGWVPNPPPSTVSINVNAASAVHTVDRKMFAVNTAVWDNGFTTPTCKSLVLNGGFKAFRFPGGSLSDGYHWKTNTTDSNAWSWATSFDDFASVAAKQSQGHSFITVNYGTGTPAEAASWVKYSNVTKHYGFKYWEVGNEVYGNWEEDGHTLKNDPVTYAQQFALYYKQMKAVDPTIQVGAVVINGEDNYANYSSEVVTNPRTHAKHSGWTPVLLAKLASLHVTPDYIIYHRYPQYAVDCDFALLTGNGGWSTDIADMRQQLTDYLGSAATKTQIMCTENNADAGTPGKQLCSLVNALYLADSFGSVLQTEANSYVWWDLINGQGTNSNDGPWLYGWRQYGDEGMFSPDFTQVYPIYYAEQILNDFAAAGDTVVHTTSSYGLLTAYAAKRANGTLRLMVINKNSTAASSAKISITGFTPVKAATQYFYGIPQDTAASQGKSQSIQTTGITNASASMSMTFPPYSITVIQLSNK